MRDILIKNFAETKKAPTPREVLSSVKLIVLISCLGAVFSIVFAILTRQGSFTSEHTLLLVGLCIVVGALVFIFGLIAMCVLLWDAYVSTHIVNLDLKNEIYESHASNLESEYA